MSENTSERARITEEMVEAGLKAFNSYNRNALEFFEDRHVKELVRDVLRAALATPPAPSVPWQEQAARRCEELADKLVERASAAPSTFKRIQTNADAVELRDHARAFRALLSKPAKGE